MDGRGIIGNYLVDRELGRGGMGVVFAATHRVLGRPAAIKLLLADPHERADRVERFFNEARAAMAIHHPGIVEVYDVGIATDGRPYLAMELLAGATLTSRLANGPLPVRVAVDHARQIADALVAAHTAGVIHRDLKPDNIFVLADGRLKLVDFGIAKLANPVHVRTVTGALIGTPAYMSPEQCEGSRELDARSDLYSLGCVLFAMLTGAPPFDGGTGAIITSHMHAPPPLLRARCPSASEALAAIVATLLAKSPEHRFRDARAVLTALANPDVDTIASGSLAAPTADAPSHAPTRPSLPVGFARAESTHQRSQPLAYGTQPQGQLPPVATAETARHGSMPPSATQLAMPSQPPTDAPPHPPIPLIDSASATQALPVRRPPTVVPKRRGAMFAIALLGCGITAAAVLFATRSCATTAAPPADGAIAALAPDAAVVVPRHDDAALDDKLDLRSFVHDAAPDAAVAIDKLTPKPKPKPKPDIRIGTTTPDAGAPRPPADAAPAPPADAHEQTPPPKEDEPEFDERLVFTEQDFTLPAGADAVLDKIAAIAHAHPTMRILLIGHAFKSERGAQQLAIARANAVLVRLVNRKIDRNRLRITTTIANHAGVRIIPEQQ